MSPESKSHARFSIHEIARELNQLEFGGEAEQVLRVAEQEIAAFPEPIGEGLHHPASSLEIEVDEDVSAEDHVHRRQEAGALGVEEVEPAEAHALLHLGLDARAAVIDRVEEAGALIARRRPEQAAEMADILIAALDGVLIEAFRKPAQSRVDYIERSLRALLDVVLGGDPAVEI